MHYKSDHCSVNHSSDLAPGEAESLIGKTICRIEADEYTLRISFTDRYHLVVSGHNFEDSPLEVFIKRMLPAD